MGMINSFEYCFACWLTRITQLNSTMQTDQKVGSLKEELNAIVPQLEEMWKSKIERRNQFLDVIGQIQKLSSELYGLAGHDNSMAVVDENDLSLRRLEELQNHLQSLQIEKVHLILLDVPRFLWIWNSSLCLPGNPFFLQLALILSQCFDLQSARLKLVMEHLNILASLCSVLGLDFKGTVRELHPSLADSEESQCISTDTIQKLESAIMRLRELKLQRMQRVHFFGLFSLLFQSLVYLFRNVHYAFWTMCSFKILQQCCLSFGI